MIGRALPAVALIAAAAPALAQEQPDFGTVSTAAVTAACREQAGDPLLRAKLAEWVLLTSSISPADHAPPGLTVAGTRQWALDVVYEPERHLQESPMIARSNDPTLLRRLVVRVLAVRSLLNANIGREGSSLAKLVSVTPESPPRGGNWLFASETYSLRCAGPSPRVAPTFDRYPLLAVRKTVDELQSLGDARAAAGSAQLSYQRDRVTDLSGETRRTRTLTIDASIGLAVPGSNVDRSLMAYADYSRHRQRIATKPTPVRADRDGRLNDVDVLEVGLAGTGRIPNVLRATGRIGYIIDSVTGARLLIGNAQINPLTGGAVDLGLCRLDIFTLLLPGIETRCFVRAEADLRHVARTGRATFTEADELIETGGTIGLDIRKAIARNGSLPDGLVGRLSYTYIPLISGRGPDIDRFEAGIAYRWWAGDVAFDLGFNYTDGTERKSLADEHKFGVVFGILY